MSPPIRKIPKIIPEGVRLKKISDKKEEVMPIEEHSIRLTGSERMIITKKVAIHYAQQWEAEETMDDIFSYVEQLLVESFLLGKERR